MKTDVIPLERNDDIDAVEEAFRWSRAPRVAFTFPLSHAKFGSLADFILMRRLAEQHGKQVAIVAKNWQLKTNAEASGIPVFPSSYQAQRQAWHAPMNPKPAIKNPVDQKKSLSEMRKAVDEEKNGRKTSAVGRWAAFVIGLGAFVALGVFFLPSAEITLQLPEREQSLEFDIRASAAIQESNLSGGVPAVENTLIVEKSGQTAATGSIALPVASASGEVTFTNLTDQEVILPKGSVVITLETPVRRFQTIEERTLPAEADAQVNAPVQALEAGSQGNVLAGTIRAVEGALGLSVSVINENALAGGADQLSAAPSLADYEQLRGELLQELVAEARKQFQQAQNPVELIIPDSVAVKEILDEQRQPAEGLAGDTLNLRIKAEMKVLAVHKADLEKSARMALDASIPEGWESVASTLVVEPVGEPVITDTTVHQSIRAVRQIRPQVQSQVIASSITGLELQDCQKQLRDNLSLQTLPQIQTFPAGWPRMPFLPLRIRVVVE
jgi:hypothetical protein